MLMRLKLRQVDGIFGRIEADRISLLVGFGGLKGSDIFNYSFYGLLDITYSLTFYLMFYFLSSMVDRHAV